MSNYTKAGAIGALIAVLGVTTAALAQSVPNASDQTIQAATSTAGTSTPGQGSSNATPSVNISGTSQGGNGSDVLTPQSTSTTGTTSTANTSATTSAPAIGIPMPFGPNGLTGQVSGSAGTSTSPAIQSNQAQGTSSANVMNTAPSIMPLNVSALAPTPAPVVIVAGSAGDVLIRGIVRSATTDSVVIQSWGGPWTLRMISGGSVIAGAASAEDMSGIAAGDFIGAQGHISATEPYTVDVTLMRDWTTDPYPGIGAAVPNSTSTPIQ
jgi:hypothetical protein